MTPHAHGEGESTLKWRVLLTCSLAFSLCHAYRTSLAIVLKELQLEYGLSYGGAAVLVGVYDAGYTLTLIFGGYVVMAMGRRRAIGASMVMLALTAAASAWAAPSFALLLLYRFLAGFAFSLYFTSGFSLIGEAFASHERGRAYGMHTVGSAVGRGYGAVLAGAVAGIYGWRLAFSSYAAVALLAAIVFWLATRGVGDRQGAETAKPINIRELLRRPAFQVACLLNTVMFIHFFVTMSFLPLYLREVKGLELGRTTLLIAVISIIAVVSNPTCGWLSDRWRRMRVAYLVFSCNIALIFVLQASSSEFMLMIYAVVFGMFLTANVGVLLAYLTESDPECASSVALGVFNSISVASGVTMNWVLGQIADVFGLQASFYALALIIAAGMSAGLVLLRRTRGRQAAAGVGEMR